MRSPALPSLVFATVLALGSSAVHAGTSKLSIFGGWGDERITGSGKVVTQARTVAGYRAVAAVGPVSVVLRQSGKEAATVQADDNIVPVIETRVVDGKEGKTLEIGIKEGVHVSTRNSIVVTVDAGEVTAITLSGSGDLRSDGLRTTSLRASVTGSGDMRLRHLAAESLHVSVAGSGDFTASGKVERQSVSLAGSGDVHNERLESNEASVSIAGSGDVRIKVKDRLKVSLVGSGDLYYRGEPKVEQSIVGTGDVHKE